MSKSLILDYDLLELTDLLGSWGEPAYRSRQIWRGLYKNFLQSPEEFTSLPKKLQTRLGEELHFKALFPVDIRESSSGQTQKILFRLVDDQYIEVVLLRYPHRRTLCISTQVGCAMGCIFCATGQMGFRRHLSSGEIVAQVMYYACLLHEKGDRITNVVMMGMGEPFHNYHSTMEAIDRLNDPEGYNFGGRRITISTVGLVPMIYKFADEKRQINLAVSLHAADDDLRSNLLPINKKYPINELIDACHHYVNLTGRRISFEWTLINQINDTPDQARTLASKLKGLLCHVNTIPLNPTSGYVGQPTTRQRARIFKAILEKDGISCTIRNKRGTLLNAGCGQLRSDQIII